MSPRAMAEGQTVIEDAVKWLSGQWLEVGSFIATCAALFYAQLAYRSSENNTKQARAAELTSLRIQAKAGLDDAQRSLLALRSTCQANRAEWQSHRLRQGLVFGQAGAMFQSSPAEKAESRGQAILYRVRTHKSA